MASKKNKSKKSPRRPKAKPAKAKKPITKNAAPKPALPKDLEKRLRALARHMEKTMDAVMLQALCEFADAWEDHFRNMRDLQDDDRIQLSVKPE